MTPPPAPPPFKEGYILTYANIPTTQNKLKPVQNYVNIPHAKIPTPSENIANTFKTIYQPHEKILFYHYILVIFSYY